MRLLHMTTVPYTLGFFRGQAAFLRERGIQLCVLSSPGEALQRFASEEAVPAYAVSMQRQITPLRDLLALVRLTATLRAARPDVLDAHSPKAGLLGMIAGRLAGVGVCIYHLHGLPAVTSTGLRRSLLLWSDRIACRLAHRVICVSVSLRDLAVRLGVGRSDRLTVLGLGSISGVDALSRFSPERVTSKRSEIRTRFGIPGDATVIGFVGRVVRDKGFAELLTAWRELRHEWPLMHLLVVGPFEDHDPLPNSIREELERDPGIHMAGEDWNTPALYAAMDIVTLPSYREGLPIVLLEAAAMGLPVVATTVSGCIDVVENGQTGMLIPPYDALSLLAALRRYVGDSELRRAHGQAARERVLRLFEQSVVWEAHVEEYRRLVMESASDRAIGMSAIASQEDGATATEHAGEPARSKP